MCVWRKNIWLDDCYQMLTNTLEESNYQFYSTRVNLFFSFHLLGVPYITANLYYIHLSTCFMFTKADAVQICCHILSTLYNKVKYYLVECSGLSKQQMVGSRDRLSASQYSDPGMHGIGTRLFGRSVQSGGSGFWNSQDPNRLLGSFGIRSRYLFKKRGYYFVSKIILSVTVSLNLIELG